VFVTCQSFFLPFKKIFEISQTLKNFTFFRVCYMKTSCSTNECAIYMAPYNP